VRHAQVVLRESCRLGSANTRHLFLSATFLPYSSCFIMNSLALACRHKQHGKQQLLWSGTPHLVAVQQTAFGLHTHAMMHKRPRASLGILLLW